MICFDCESSSGSPLKTALQLSLDTLGVTWNAPRLGTLCYSYEMKNLKQTIQSLEARVVRLKKEIIVLYFIYTDPRVGLIPRVLIFVTLGYALSPIDLIPDFIPVLGYLDDLIILPALVALSLKLIPSEIKKEARLKADREPCELKNNWIFAVLIVFIWVSAAFFVVRIILRARKPL